ncbi:universal stress protein [Hymenobacter profundi]|uniref:Universal stress protein n=1 Tax=Hymenobacter profundi TaxID=1982110 RepID=A0ABS6WZ64_9BACT|nr:universal stress protein [Hymenobacter profundi]MBW3128889.1 universal stress protein [Hymenobacter profundi]
MTLTTVLCPLDFSVASAPLVRYATTLAAATGAELRLLHVLEAQPELPMAGLARPLDLDIALQLANYRLLAEQEGVVVSTAIVQGDAATEIVAEAQRHPADLILIGAHGRTGLTRFLMGSTAEAVVRTAPCATLLVKNCQADEYRQSA